MPKIIQPESGGARVRTQEVWLRQEVPFSLRMRVPELGKGAHARPRGCSLQRWSALGQCKTRSFCTTSPPPGTTAHAPAGLPLSSTPESYLEISSVL